jgi:sugar phosphate isomerase/epimerase
MKTPDRSLCLILAITSLLVLGCASKSPFEQSNLVAWCIVPFDLKNRSPEERAQMLSELGITRFAYDWRSRHIDEFEREIIACQQKGIEFFAFWNEHPEAFRLFKKHGIQPQIWKTLRSPDSGISQDERVAAAGNAFLPLVEATREMDSQLGLYNHGGWGGEPANLVAVVQWLRNQTDAEHVGIVYNLHHGHDQLDDLAKNIELMKPYLLCFNLNGMNREPDPKILAIGKGARDQEWFRVLAKSGYKGPLGILGHQSDRDARECLEENLAGLNALQSK